ncbi:MAG: hypothetical protein D6718_03835 [Acidobacteria bacterium]|nr:MAG: hypothetical protein D6718_03835 [Acidobacteriota bacterium]
MEGRGIPWVAGRGNDLDRPASLETLERLAREFVERHEVLLGRWGKQLVLDRDASGPAGEGRWRVVFRQMAGGVPVDGARFVFEVVEGNLVSFGTSRWAPLTIDPTPRLDEAAARAALARYLDLDPDDPVLSGAEASLHIVPIDPRRASALPWNGPRGKGYGHVLVWRLRFRVPGEPATWVGEIDAHTGEPFAFWDDTHYDAIRGGVFPITNDGDCANDGCETAGFPMPFADYSVDGTAAGYSGDHGQYTCTELGAPVETTLNGQYVRVHDNCGAISEQTTCDLTLDLGTSPGTNCNVASGASSGNTRAARTSFYHLNVVKQKARFYLPDNTWLQGKLTDNVNIANTCNAYWNGSVNFYREGGGCRNTGEIQGVVVHEWGHGLDSNDGGGMDNPSEAYADVVAIFESRESCIGRGFYINGTCSGYGDPCLECTGIREMDWDKRQSHTPATPAGFTANNCGGGGGPCGKEVHCESYVPSEAIWDLATRDLPASGLDPDTSWQIAEKLWYMSRDGSGGNVENCSLPDSDGCGVDNWFHKLRVADDDDGNLDNGTPHAAAIFAAFDRHGIACGTASDPSNQNHSSCPSLSAPTLNARGVSEAVELTWDEVPNAAEYIIYRNDVGCERGQVPIARVSAPAGRYLDEGLINDFPVYYRIQARGSNPACDGPVSNCVEATPIARAGSVSFATDVLSCRQTANMDLVDSDLNTDPDVVETVVLPVTSTTEPDPEMVLFTETGPSTGRFTGSIGLAPGPPVAGDGVLQASDGDVLTVTYVDADDGFGEQRTVFDTAHADCVEPRIKNLRVEQITDQRMTVRFETDEPGDTVVEWGDTPALGNRFSDSTLTTVHEVLINTLDICRPYYLKVSSTDAYGNVAVSGGGGKPHAVHTYDIPGLYYRETFENGTNGWTLTGEWQVGAPQGLGATQAGNPDPSAAYNNAAVLGNDLTGLGDNPGDYEMFADETATMPTQDASSWTNTKLLLYRHLNVDSADTASISVVAGGETEVFSNAGSAITDSDYSLMTLDLSAQMDGKPQAALRFRLTAGNHSVLPNGSIINGEYSGWNIDDVILKDGSLPDYAACGGCGQAPAFRGATSAVDNDACGASGVTVTWDPALSWGTGNGGTYAVYRDTSPGFTPGPGNLIAAGLTGTSYTDTTAPPDQTVYYLVRAENDETCGSGPNNGGLLDDNTVYVSATESTSPPAVGPVESVTVRIVNRAHVRLEWPAVAGADHYNVYRSTDPHPETFTLIGGDERTFFEDENTGTDGTTYFYFVRAVDACGREGP